MRRILVVDDDALARKNISAFLASEGYRVEQASDGIEALEVLKKHLFDLVLSDIVMPRMDGFALIQHVRSNYPHTRILAMTAYFQADSETRFSVAGSDGFIRKPVVFDDLLSRIQHLLPQERS